MTICSMEHIYIKYFRFTEILRAAILPLPTWSSKSFSISPSLKLKKILRKVVVDGSHTKMRMVTLLGRGRIECDGMNGKMNHEGTSKAEYTEQGEKKKNRRGFVFGHRLSLSLFLSFLCHCHCRWKIKSKQSFSFNYKINEANSYGILM